MGIQTEYCVDTTCRVAFELGYRVVMPEMTNTTYDSGLLTAALIHAHHNREIFVGRFASVPPMEEAVALLAARRPPAAPRAPVPPREGG